MTMALPQARTPTIREGAAASSINDIPGANPIGEMAKNWYCRFAGFQMNPDALISSATTASYPEFHVDILPKNEGESTAIDFGTYWTEEEDILMDERVPRLALATLPIQLMLKIGGKGEPRIRIETEFGSCDENS